jgi:hypothetical protein
LSATASLLLQRVDGRQDDQTRGRLAAETSQGSPERSSPQRFRLPRRFPSSVADAPCGPGQLVIVGPAARGTAGRADQGRTTCRANGPANETVRDGGDAADDRRRPRISYARSMRPPRTAETGKTCVACLIAQRITAQRHARAQACAIGHPIVQSFEPGEDWRCCYVDEAYV